MEMHSKASLYKIHGPFGENRPGEDKSRARTLLASAQTLRRSQVRVETSGKAQPASESNETSGQLRQSIVLATPLPRTNGSGEASIRFSQTLSLFVARGMMGGGQQGYNRNALRHIVSRHQNGSTGSAKM
jgi:hypothetical protein